MAYTLSDSCVNSLNLRLCQNCAREALY
jgi:hypothetical protein